MGAGVALCSAAERTTTRNGDTDVSETETDTRALYRLSWTDCSYTTPQVDPLHRYDLTETLRLAQRRAVHAEHVTVTRFPHDDTSERAGVIVWSDGRFMTPDTDLLTTACTFAGDLIHAQSAQHIGRITVTDARTVSFRAVDWDGTPYVVTVRTEAQSNARTRQLLDPIGSAHAVIRDCAECCDQTYVFASESLSDAHAAQHATERAS